MSQANATGWVVVATWTEDGEVRCETFAEGLATKEEAEDVAYQMLQNLGAGWDGTLEAATARDAAAVVSE